MNATAGNLAVIAPQSTAVSTAAANGRMAVADIIQHVAVVQEVMRAVMKKEVHYGIIPGTDKPTLYKAGAEVLCMVFKIADEYAVEDLSTSDTIRYRVTCTGIHQLSRAVLGSGMGEASSGEEKYKWRKAYETEYSETPANLRRKKTGYSKKEKKNYETFQVRTEPADLANTILKMANKRAKMAMVLNVTAASDCFAQDLEDMDEALRDHLTRHGEEGQQQPEEPAHWPDEAFTRQLAKATPLIQAGTKTAADIIATLKTKAPLTEAQEAAVNAVKPNPPAAETKPAEAPAIEGDFVAGMERLESGK